MLEWILNMENVFYDFLTSDLGRATIFCMLLFWIGILIIIGILEILTTMSEKKEVK